MPDYSSGRRLHDLYVNKVVSALPGNYSQLFGTGPAFRSVFFPDWRADPLMALVGDAGLDDGWWRGFSVAVLCQAIADMGSNIRGQMLTDKINGDVASFNATLRTRSARCYAQVLAATFDPLISLLRQVNRSTAKQQFHDSLLSNVLNRQLWYQAGKWTSPEWEMFNQYAKYIALGATDAEVDALIVELVAAGLPVPSSVGSGAWRSYSEELRDKPDVDVNDIRTACSQAVKTSTWLPSYGGAPPSQMPNGNCFEFTANRQPGSPYRRPPGGSCFTGDTEVLDATGSPVALAQVVAGDEILTRDGTGTVGYVAQPLREQRRLYRLAGGGPVFTATHPFLNGTSTVGPASAPSVLAVEPQTLAWGVPTLSENGIGTLTAGSTVLSRQPGPGGSVVPVTVAAVEEAPVRPEDSHLYDLRLTTTSGARQEFWVGGGTTFYLVSAEYPVLDEAGAAATTVVALMEGLLGSNGPEGAGWPEWVIDVVNQFGPGVFHNAMMEALAVTPSFGAPSPPDSIYNRIDRLYRGLDSASKETAAVVASLFDGLLASIGQWLSSLVALGWRTSVLLGGDVLAVTVFDIALTPANPLPADAPVQLGVEIAGRAGADDTHLWDRRGRENTRFHHYFDQIVHLDLAGGEVPTELRFALRVQEAAIPSLFASVPGAGGDSTHRLQSAVLHDAAGAVVGEIRFDSRRLGRDRAALELADSGLWTGASADAYANALGVAMVEPILWRLREFRSGSNR
ncbi:MAG TPA: hypothetical protein VFP89_16205 [Propionibacteriaceae bacterium]|nr:hypothetical protein [Propionibacteriaceae bacterium]